MQTCSCFFPSIALGHGLEMVVEVLFHIFSVPVPLDDLRASLDVDGSRFSVQAKPAPVPEFESEYVGSSAYLKDHASGP